MELRGRVVHPLGRGERRQKLWSAPCLQAVPRTYEGAGDEPGGTARDAMHAMREWMADSGAKEAQTRAAEAARKAQQDALKQRFAAVVKAAVKARREAQQATREDTAGAGVGAGFYSRAAVIEMNSRHAQQLRQMQAAFEDRMRAVEDR